MIWCRKPKPT